MAVKHPKEIKLSVPGLLVELDIEGVLHVIAPGLGPADPDQEAMVVKQFAAFILHNAAGVINYFSSETVALVCSNFKFDNTLSFP